MEATNVSARAQEILGELSAEDRKLIERHLKGSKGNRKSPTEIEEKYPHVVKGTVRYNETAKKQEADIKCQHPGCEAKPFTKFTSDLWQVNMCDEHKKEQAKAKKAAADARVAAILAEKGISVDDLKKAAKS